MIQVCANEHEGDEFKAWCLQTLGPALLSGGSTIDRLVVNLAVPTPATQPYGSGESLEGDAFDVVLQIWAPRFDTIVRSMLPIAAEFAARTRVQHVYRLTETEVVRAADLPRRGESPGIKLIRGLYFFDDLPDPAVQRLWAHHSGLAVKVHVGLVRYARHWVDSILTPGSPTIQGFSDLHFPR